MKKHSPRAPAGPPKVKPRRRKGRFDGLPPSCTPVILATREARGRK